MFKNPQYLLLLFLLPGVFSALIAQYNFEYDTIRICPWEPLEYYFSYPSLLSDTTVGSMPVARRRAGSITDVILCGHNHDSIHIDYIANNTYRVALDPVFNYWYDIFYYGIGDPPGGIDLLFASDVDTTVRAILTVYLDECNEICRNYQSTNLIPIPFNYILPNAIHISDLDFTPGYILIDSIKIKHKRESEISLYLKNPIGDSILLMDQMCLDEADSIINIGFSDVLIRDTNLFEYDCNEFGVDCHFQPDEPLANLITENVNGTWTLIIKDNQFNEFNGELESWSISFCPSLCTCQDEDLNVSQLELTSKLYQVAGNIVSDATIAPLEIVKFRAGEFVSLTNNFEVPDSASFSAETKPCLIPGTSYLVPYYIDVDTVVTAKIPTSGGGCQNCSGGAQNATWYQMTIPSSGVLTVSSCGGGADTRLWIYELQGNDLMYLDESDDFCDLGDGRPYASETQLSVSAGDIILLEWDDRWINQVSVFDFSINMFTN